MNIIIKRWGNSLAVRIPKSFADQANIENGSTVDLALEKDQLVISAIPSEYDLDSLLDIFYEQEL